MESKFEFKDIMNSILSGLLWETAIIMMVYLANPQIVELINWEFIQNSNVVIFTLLIITAFLLGIILRGFEKPFTTLYKCVFGSPYNMTLYVPKKSTKPQAEKSDCKLFENWIKPARLNKRISKTIRTNLCKLDLIQGFENDSDDSSDDQTEPCENVKDTGQSIVNIGIMAERYLMLNKIDGTFGRFKDIKNLFESISFPLFLTLILAKWVFFNEANCFLYFLILVILYILFILRYNYYYRNYVKDIFRMIYFAKV